MISSIFSSRVLDVSTDDDEINEDETGDETEFNYAIVEFSDSVIGYGWCWELSMVPEMLIDTVTFSLPYAQKLCFNFVRNAQMGCSLYVGTNNECPACYVIFETALSEILAYEIGLDWYGFSVNKFLSAGQIGALNQDDNSLAICIRFSMERPPGRNVSYFKVDEILSEPYQVNKMPYFDNFIINAVEPDKIEEEFNKTIGSEQSVLPRDCSMTSPFRSLRLSMITHQGPNLKRTRSVSSSSCVEADDEASNIGIAAVEPKTNVIEQGLSISYSKRKKKTKLRKMTKNCTQGVSSLFTGITSYFRHTFLRSSRH